MPLAAGTRLGSYEVLAPLGAGGMAEVYRARDTKLKREVAIKVLPQHLTNDPEALARFEREAQAVAALSHPNILAIHDFGTLEGIAYAVTELLEGETLRARLGRGPLATSKAIDVALQMVNGLAAAHAKGIVHRDLKPENVFLTRDGHVKILDFGLAKLRGPLSEGGDEAESSPTRARPTIPGTVLGTIGYMSPEQVRGREADHRSDIFSFGTILYEMVSGQRAFRSDSAAETLSAILKEDAPDVLQSKAAVPPALERLVRRCLEKDPEERFQSSRDLRFALEAISDLRRDSESGWATAVAAEAEVTPSIAVLPFTDMSPQKDQEYFCEGMAEEIINALTKTEGLRVAARMSAFRFKDKAQDVREVGRALNVRTVLQGSVRTAGTKLRVAAQLVHVADGYQVWSERYDRELEDVFAIQDQIASSIVDALRIKLIGGKDVEPIKRYTKNLEAYHLYLKGRHAWERRYQGGPMMAVPFFQQAVEKDPSYALAHAGLADCYTMLGVYGFLPAKEAREKAAAAAARAIALDDGVAEGHTALARLRLGYDCRFDEAEREFQRAVELNPADVQARVWYGLHLALVGRHPEAEAQFRRAKELDPVSSYVNFAVAIAHLWTEANEEAIAECEKALETDPDFTGALWVLGLACARVAQPERAIQVLEKLAGLTRRAPFYLGLLAWAYGRAGRDKEARALLEELRRRADHEYVAPVSFAVLLSGLGDTDGVFEWLERILEERDCLVFFVKLPVFDSVREDPRFHDVLRRLGFPIQG